VRYILDTNVFLWALNNHKRLKTSVKEIIVNPDNEIFVSVVSAWEISIKLKTNPRFKLRTSIKKAFELSGFEILDINFMHVLDMHKLPLYHKDPFDRILIAQAKVEDLTLITADAKIKKYKVKTLY